MASDRYAAFRDDARALMGDLNESRDGGVELSSAYLNVLARR